MAKLTVSVYAALATTTLLGFTIARNYFITIFITWLHAGMRKFVQDEILLVHSISFLKRGSCQCIWHSLSIVSNFHNAICASNWFASTADLISSKFLIKSFSTAYFFQFWFMTTETNGDSQLISLWFRLPVF
jgi:hypothetical protein